jgi:hypothetical protein
MTLTQELYKIYYFRSATHLILNLQTNIYSAS